MLLEYEWGNPASAAAAMLLFGDDQSGQDACQERQLPVFDPHYVHSLGMDFFQQPQPITSAALFSAATGGMMLPPPAPARIGLNLGVRTYFSSVSLEEEEIMARRARRRRTRTARCQAEGCGADLTHAKHYHRRHKVCEFHSKASVVIAAGLSQRFCQQCSRFHVLSEFDQGKRSCRKRLADHNRRRRKSQDLNAPSMAVAKDDNNTTDDTTLTTATNNNKSSDLDSALITSLCKQETSPMVTHITTSPPLAPSLAVRPMALGLGDSAIPMMTVSSASSSNTRPQAASFVSHLGDFHGHEHPFPSWNDREDVGGIGMYQNK